MHHHRGNRAILLVEIIVVFILILVTVLLIREKKNIREASLETVPSEKTEATENMKNESEEAFTVTDLRFEKRNSKEILLSWSDESDPQVKSYQILRKTLTPAGNEKEWEVIGENTSDRTSDGNRNTYVDSLATSEPQQFLYRVDVLMDDKKGTECPGGAIAASNISVCIDPGHYKNASSLSGDNLYGYDEGTYMLKVGLELKKVLEESYGISSVMTRDSDDILMDGYKNGEVDNIRISIRGEAARGQDLFISLHTNANLDNANGYPTANQPVALNKTLVFVNQVAAQSDIHIKQANSIGQENTCANYEAGLSFTDSFRKVPKDALKNWSDEFNDSLNTTGTVCYRLGDNGKDYYGVLRGAAEVGVPGFIVEHAFHTIEEVRKESVMGNQTAAWAQADAAGIAAGYSFVKIGE